MTASGTTGGNGLKRFGLLLLLAYAALGIVALRSAVGDEEPKRKNEAAATARATATPSPSPSPTPTPSAAKAAPAAPRRSPARELKQLPGGNGSTARVRLVGTAGRVEVIVKVSCSARVARCEVGRSSDGRRIERRIGRTRRGRTRVHREVVPLRRLATQPFVLVVKRYPTRGRVARRVILRTRIDRLLADQAGAAG